MLLANVLWGLMSPISKSLMLGGILSPLVLTDIRITGAMVLFWVLSLFRPVEKVSPKDMLSLFFASLLAIVFNQGFFILGVSMTSPGTASIITTSLPLWTMLFSALILHEPITGKKVLGILMGAIGALFLILGGSSSVAGNGPIWGDIFVILAEMSYALYIVKYKNFISKYSLVTIMKWMFTFAFLSMLPFSLSDVVSTEWNLLGFKEIASIVFIVVGATFFSYMLVLVGQRILRPTIIGMYNYVQPIVACMVAICIGLDSFDAGKMVSIAFIFGGVYLVTQSLSRKDMEAREHQKTQKQV